MFNKLTALNVAVHPRNHRNRKNMERIRKEIEPYSLEDESYEEGSAAYQAELAEAILASAVVVQFQA